jgi:hypothetical protein
MGCRWHREADSIDILKFNGRECLVFCYLNSLMYCVGVLFYLLDSVLSVINTRFNPGTKYKLQAISDKLQAYIQGEPEQSIWCQLIEMV